MHADFPHDQQTAVPAPDGASSHASGAATAGASLKSHLPSLPQQVHLPAKLHRGHRAGGGGSTTTRMLIGGMVALLVAGVAVVATGVVQLGPPGTGPTDVEGGTGTDGAWSYYHDRDYDSGSGGAKWATDRSRSSDPNEAVLGDTTRWEYDGPYRYGPYGSDGMERRSTGSGARDPLYSQPAPIQDVFSQYGGDLDPSGGQPVGVAPSSMTNPYYDPYAGYSNPYSNRIRMAYGEGVGRGASYTP